MNFKIGRIVDFISDDDTELYTLFKLVEFCQKNQVDLIDFFFTGNFHIKSLEKLNFINASQKPFNAIPFLFNPIVRNRELHHFAFKIMNEGLSEVDANDFNKWYLTKGDGDMERPY